MPTFLRRTCLVAVAFLAITPAAKAAKTDEHLFTGNPSAATADRGKPDNFLVKKRQYALSYNNSKGTANWVSWVRHEVADVAVLRSEERPTAPAVLPAVSYGACVSGNGTCQAPRQRSLLR